MKTHLAAHTSLTYRCLESPTTPVKQNSKWGGYNLDVAWDHKIYTARKLGKLSPSATTENTHAPGPNDRL